MTLEYNTLIVLVGTVALGMTAGIVGCLALLRRRALLGDALSHATLPGICLAFILLGQRDFPFLLGGALVTGLLGVTTVAVLTRWTRIKEDTATGLVLSLFFGVGITLSSYIQNHSTTGAQAGIDSFILGKTAGMVLGDLYFIGGTAIAVLLVIVLFYKELKLLSFDSAFAAVEGWPVLRLDLLFLLLLTVTTVIGLPAVGVVLMVALLVIPAAAARLWTQRLGTMMALSALFGAITGAVGTLLSTSYPNLPAGPVIVLAAAGIFVVSVLAAPHRGVIARTLSLRQMRRRRERRKLLVFFFERREQGQSILDTGDFEKAFGGPQPRGLSDVMRDGWVSGGEGSWELTEQGLDRAMEVTRAHRLWVHYLLTEAEIDRDLVDPDTDTIEAILPAEVVARLQRELRADGRFPERSALPC
ncbi:MAG: iron chelate uptake ABC transporter family permease subunit [Planctomycetota bacterium]